MTFLSSLFAPWEKHQKHGHRVARHRDIGMEYIQCDDCHLRWHISGPVSRWL